VGYQWPSVTDELIPKQSDESEELSESPYTIPNALTVARIVACPFLGYYIVQGDYVVATSLLFACGVSDWVSVRKTHMSFAYDSSTAT